MWRSIRKFSDVELEVMLAAAADDCEAALTEEEKEHFAELAQTIEDEIQRRYELSVRTP